MKCAFCGHVPDQPCENQDMADCCDLMEKPEPRASTGVRPFVRRVRSLYSMGDMLLDENGIEIAVIHYKSVAEMQDFRSWIDAQLNEGGFLDK